MFTCHPLARYLKWFQVKLSPMILFFFYSLLTMYVANFGSGNVSVVLGTGEMRAIYSVWNVIADGLEVS